VNAHFEPHGLIRSRHLQTVLGSRGRGFWVRRRAADLMARSAVRILETPDGVRLEVREALQAAPAPAVVILHGWLGHSDSGYVLSAAAELWKAGFSVFRLNLRDHGDTAHLNEEMFHSARIDEVVAALELLGETDGVTRLGVVGFSLGGNFALRVARATGLDTLAVCPAVDPALTMTSIDGGLPIYRWFFVRKWHRALHQKARAFPGRYRFDEALRLKTVSELTELFVADHTDFPSVEAYFAAYSLIGNALEGVSAKVVFAEDDPVIPAESFRALPDTIRTVATRFGGHCAFVETLPEPTWVDRHIVEHFENSPHS
jgi:predicted alpha/beta-fold hydrolase